MNLMNLMAARNSLHRIPCKPDGAEYEAFEKRFHYNPTEDQIICFQV